jgi:small subunit ribosomal protein S15
MGKLYPSATPSGSFERVVLFQIAAEGSRPRRRPSDPMKDLAFFHYPCYDDLMLTKRVKSRIIGEHKKNDKDTGSASVQIAMTSRQIDELASHLKKNPKDNHSRRGLLKMVSKRRKLLSYLHKKEPSVYEKLIKKLELKR